MLSSFEGLKALEASQHVIGLACIVCVVCRLPGLFVLGILFCWFFFYASCCGLSDVGSKVVSLIGMLWCRIVGLLVVVSVQTHGSYSLISAAQPPQFPDIKLSWIFYLPFSISGTRDLRCTSHLNDWSTWIVIHEHTSNGSWCIGIKG